MAIKAALFDMGGVLTTSPFDGFAAYERAEGLPAGFLRRLNATDADTNAWARLERNELDADAFCVAFEAEAEAAGHRVDATRVLACLDVTLRPAMVEAVRRCHDRLRTALLTNNTTPMDDATRQPLDDLFDVVVESSRVGIRKPEPAFYALALAQVGVDATEAVFLDDLGVNLKPARALGIATIKVDEPDAAIAELEAIVGFPLR